MLYREFNGKLELCWTDFDSYFCKLWEPKYEGENKCSVLVHAALVMGCIRCWYSAVESSLSMPSPYSTPYDDLQPKVLDRLIKDHDIETLNRAEACEWLLKIMDEDTVIPSTDVKRSDIADTLTDQMMHYLTGSDAQCFHGRRDQTTFKQIYDWAVRQGSPSPSPPIV